MMRILIFFLLSCLSLCVKSQDTTLAKLGEVKNNLENFIVRPEKIAISKFKSAANLLLNDPGVYNDLWGKVYNSLRDTNKLVFKNLKLEFKTFQGTDSNKTSLGFSYNWSYDMNRNKNTDYERSGLNAKMSASGNIAIQKSVNPIDFQKANIVLGKYGFLGGTVNKLDKEAVEKLNKIKLELANINDKKVLAESPLWNELTKAMGIKNHYHYDFSAIAGWEGTQDFSKSQFTYGAQLRFSAKSYTDNNPLSQLNILDYPFALIRFLTGTDMSLKPYGATLPIITTGIEIIKPTEDSIRKKVTGDEKQFTRFRFEAGFRTLLAEVNDIKLHFNAAYRYFRELNAPASIKAANLNKFSYFTFSITGAESYFVSYSYGNLPFDRSANAVYEIGFKTNF